MSWETLSAVRRRIQERGASWNAEYTTVSQLPRSTRQKMLGLAFGPEIIEKRRYLLQAESLQLSRPAFPPRFTWLNYQRYDWVTRIREQGICGSCVAFACIAVLESQLMISNGISRDLSEAFLFFCGDGDCEAGWEIEPAMRFLQQQGVTDELCFPYMTSALPQPCGGQCADWRNRLYRITDFKAILSPDFVKEWISSNGPMVAAMDVYDDFSYYGGGVYSHVHGEEIGQHAIALVGYDDPSSFWICKNSWGTGWGEEGFFKIRYGECGICVRYPVWGMRGPISP